MLKGLRKSLESTHNPHPGDTKMTAYTLGNPSQPFKQIPCCNYDSMHAAMYTYNLHKEYCNAKYPELSHNANYRVSRLPQTNPVASLDIRKFPGGGILNWGERGTNEMNDLTTMSWDRVIHKHYGTTLKRSCWANLQEPVSKTIWKETSEEAAEKVEKQKKQSEHFDQSLQFYSSVTFSPKHF